MSIQFTSVKLFSLVVIICLVAATRLNISMLDTLPLTLEVGSLNVRGLTPNLTISDPDNHIIYSVYAWY